MKKYFTLIAMMLFAAVGAFAQTYTVVGNAAIMNGTASWDPTNTENDMVKVEDELYQLVVTGCKVEADTYEWKIAANHAWGQEGEYPGSGNLSLVIPETGIYTITFTYGDESGLGLGWEASAEAVKTGDWTPDGAVVLTVAGSSVPLLGSSWDPTDTNNDMTLTSGTTYQLVKKSVTLGKGVIEYKVVKDHSWGSAWPSNNASFNIEEDGTYDVTFTFDYATKSPSVDVQKTGSAQIDHYWTIAGAIAGATEGETTLFGPYWDPSCTDNDMTEQTDGTWTLVKENVALEAVTYAFKACFDHSWATNYGDPDTADGNALLEITKAGNYNVTFTLDLTEGAEKVSATAQNLDGGSSAISEVSTEARNATVYYNLMGIRTDRPQHGVFIQNGRKVVVK